jgi:hypothetical protein
VSKLVETDIAQYGQRHEEDEGGIQQHESGLSNVCVVEKNETGSQDTSRQRIARFPHDHKDNRDSKSTHSCGHGTVRHVRHLVGDVRVANVLKQKLALVTNQPSGKCEQKLAKGRVYIEKVGSLEVV